MKALFVDFGGNPTKKKMEALAQLLEGYGLTPMQAEIEQPKPKIAPEPVEMVPGATVEEPVAVEPEPDTRLEDNKDETASKPKRRGGFPKPKRYELSDAVFLGMIVSDGGHECPVGAIKGPSKADKYCLGLLKEDEAGYFIEANGRWWREHELIQDESEPTTENAEMLLTVYPPPKKEKAA